MIIDCRNSERGTRLKMKQTLNSKGFKRCVLLADRLKGVDVINILPSKKWFYSKLKPNAKIDMTAEEYLKQQT